MRYVESRLVSGQWVAFAEVSTASRRKAMKHFAKGDDKDAPKVQRRVRQDDETEIPASES